MVLLYHHFARGELWKFHCSPTRYCSKLGYHPQVPGGILQPTYRGLFEEWPNPTSNERYSVTSFATETPFCPWLTFWLDIVSYYTRISIPQNWIKFNDSAGKLKIGRCWPQKGRESSLPIDNPFVFRNANWKAISIQYIPFEFYELKKC